MGFTLIWPSRRQFFFGWFQGYCCGSPSRRQAYRRRRAWPWRTEALAGHYYLQGVHEVGSELLLHPDGRFEYFLAYGAYDESATGTWTLQGGQVLLNTAGAAAPPRFRLKQSASQPEKPLTILVQDQNGRGLAGHRYQHRLWR